MELKTKKQVNGKPVAVFSTEGMNIADIVSEMTQDGWTFDKLVVSYPNKNGGTSTKEVKAEQVPAIIEKWNFDNWKFTASRNNQKLSGKVINSKEAALISEAKNGALNDFKALGKGGFTTPVPSPKQPAKKKLTPEQVQARQAKAARAKMEQNIPVVSENEFMPKEKAKSAAVSALYDDDEADFEYQMPTVPQNASKPKRKKTVPSTPVVDTENIEPPKSKNPILLIIFAVLEFLGIASIPFGIVSVVEIIGGQKRMITDPNEGMIKLKFAKRLLIIGAVFAVIFWCIIIVNMGPIILGLL